MIGVYLLYEYWSSKSFKEEPSGKGALKLSNPGGQRRKIRLFVLPPKSPKLNACVERAHRTHTEEFYEAYHCSWNVTKLNPEL